jgi:DNA invertase Pin-like site-specific DNA recombinase
MARSDGAPKRCAIYTRKSSEEGLDQHFNSLHAQRQACEAFVKSQAGEGWRLIKTPYDDGGFSGATMERPALKALLAHVTEKRIDVVVVYKVDRLTRSLADFAKIVEIFDDQGVSFVAVTQQFNTITSISRLTLNVLLSFAQFEREVTSERIRDKIAASKQKGMWMGGTPPLGYDLRDRRLVVSQPEAETVRLIFRLYLEHKTLRRVMEELDRIFAAAELKQAVDAIDAKVKSYAQVETTQDTRTLIERVELKGNGMQITLDLRALLPAARFPTGGSNLRMTRPVPLQMRRRGVETRLVLPGEALETPRTDPALLRALARGHQWFGELAAGTATSTSQIATREGLSDSYVRHMVPLALLAESICAGRQGVCLSAERLKTLAGVPIEWNAQQRLLAD